MSGAATWIGPALVAAVISALVTGAGWFVSERQAVRHEGRRRRERVVDIQTALLAEIRASRHRLEDVAEYGVLIDAQMSREERFTPFVPRQAAPVLFDAVVPDIHILPNSVIDPVIVYYRQRSVVANLVDDLRSDRYAGLNQERRRLIYADFIRLTIEADLLALHAEKALLHSLNIQAEGSSGPRSAAARGAA